MMKRAFTLIEVNLAILVMAGGILSVVVLYSLGFRESRQSREDIASAAYADAALSPLVAALSSSQLEWEDFDSVETVPENGWGGYVNQNTGMAKAGMEAKTIFDGVMGKLGSSGVKGSSNAQCPDFKGLYAGMVVCHTRNSGIVKLGFRAAKRKEELLSAPLYYTEVRFQGKQKDKGGN